MLSYVTYNHQIPASGCMAYAYGKDPRLSVRTC